MTFRSILGQDPEIIEYQVRQTPNGADIDLIANRQPELTKLTAHLLSQLESSGLEQPELNIKVVNELQRHHETNKLRRFVPLS